MKEITTAIKRAKRAQLLKRVADRGQSSTEERKELKSLSPVTMIDKGIALVNLDHPDAFESLFKILGD
jgi:hypothetical protein